MMCFALYSIVVREIPRAPLLPPPLANGDCRRRRLCFWSKRCVLFVNCFSLSSFGSLGLLPFVEAAWNVCEFHLPFIFTFFFVQKKGGSIKCNCNLQAWNRSNQNIWSEIYGPCGSCKSNDDFPFFWQLLRNFPNSIDACKFHGAPPAGFVFVSRYGKFPQPSACGNMNFHNFRTVCGWRNEKGRLLDGHKTAAASFSYLFVCPVLIKTVQNPEQWKR